jgi:hypothetical protein
MKTTTRRVTTTCLAAPIALLAACGDPAEVDDHGHDENEVITTLTLTLTPQGGGDAVTATFRDADGDGGEDPTITNPTLAADTTYDVTVTLLNETLDPDDEEYDIGAEIAEEAEEHQLFYTGSGVTDGLLTWTTTDAESDYTENTGEDLPVGLAGTLETGAAGTGTLIVTLQHQPPVNGEAVKTATSGIEDGETDVSVDFEVTVE